MDSLLCAHPGIESAPAFFKQAVATQEPRWPRKVKLDGNAASHRALRLLAAGIDPSQEQRNLRSKSSDRLA